MCLTVAEGNSGNNNLAIVDYCDPRNNEELAPQPIEDPMVQKHLPEEKTERNQLGCL